jgi:hypothetical protein
MHGGDDLLGIDPPQVDAGRAEVGVSQLALDDVQQHALTRELNGVRVTQLVRGEPTPDPGADGEPAELGTDPGTRPRPPAGGAVDDSKKRPDRQLDARGQPRAELFPTPLVHADLAATAALAVADQQRPAARVEVVLRERERFLDAEPGAP